MAASAGATGWYGLARQTNWLVSSAAVAAIFKGMIVRPHRGLAASPPLRYRLKMPESFLRHFAWAREPGTAAVRGRTTAPGQEGQALVGRQRGSGKA